MSEEIEWIDGKWIMDELWMLENTQDIVNWIVSLNKERYSKYCYGWFNNIHEQVRSAWFAFKRFETVTSV